MPTITENPLHREFQFFIENRETIVRGHEGKTVVIFDQQVQGYFDGQIEAVTAMARVKPVGTFLVQRCESDEESYSQTFHSRVML